MKRTSLSLISKTHTSFILIGLLLSFALMFTVFSRSAQAQATQLSLADILIALRSKKATLPDRNKILAEAIVTRGTTFSLTPEIEKELSVTGADRSLIDSIRQRAQIARVSPVRQPVGTRPEPVGPTADFSFYEKRADESISKGDLDAALVDYTKAIEMNGTSDTALMSRGKLYFDKGSFTLAVADFTKVIELKPEYTVGYTRRAEAYEKKGNNDLAIADYKKVLELESANETAKTSLARLQPEPPKTIEKPVVKVDPIPVPASATPVVIPEFVDLGPLTEAQATRMVKPLYSQVAYKASIGGKVVVQVEMDVEGNVTAAKVVSGHPYLRQASEDAARKSKFKPAKFGNQAVKAKGIITYNFVTTR